MLKNDEVKMNIMFYGLTRLFMMAFLRLISLFFLFFVANFLMAQDNLKINILDFDSADFEIANKVEIIHGFQIFTLKISEDNGNVTLIHLLVEDVLNPLILSDEHKVYNLKDKKLKLSRFEESVLSGNKYYLKMHKDECGNFISYKIFSISIYNTYDIGELNGKSFDLYQLERLIKKKLITDKAKTLEQREVNK